MFEPSVVGVLQTAANDATIAVDTNWQNRYADRSPESKQRAEKVLLVGTTVDRIDTDIDLETADAEFVGLARLSGETIEFVLELVDRGILVEEDDIPTLITKLSVGDVTPHAIDIEGHWAELETPEDFSRFVLDTKANTLRRLQSMVEASTILDQYTFTVGEWQTNPETVREAIADAFEESEVIVRSSALAEDTWDESNAGRFESVLDVPVGDAKSLTDAIEHVIGSYPDDDSDNQVLVQPMIADVEQSGVVMTRVLDGFSPYYVINYDATTESTESVTDGTGEHLQTAIVRKDVVMNGLDLPADTPPGSVQAPSDLSLEPLLRAVGELEELIGHDSLDIEFVIDSDDTVHVLQARPMAVDPAEETVDDEALYETVEAAREEFRRAQQPSPFLLGDRTIYGVMPDWNPAEIIGRKPHRLAASLYQYLIMNATWAKQRAEYGYRDVRPHPLMKQFAGQPYVDVRAVFNSFIPASVSEDLAERLVGYYLDRLAENPQLHDKVEFDIVLTCLTFDYDRQIEPLLEAGFSRKELEPLREGLREITQKGFDRIDEDYETIARLDTRYEQLLDSDLQPLRMAYYLLNDCCRLGTLPFAHLARNAFVATSLLRSLNRRGILTDEQLSDFQNSLNTVARRFERDAYRVATDELSWEEFVEEYGHLRPGTYEISSQAYRGAPEEYLRPLIDDTLEPESHPDPIDVWDGDTRAAIEEELDHIGLP
ncbi:MAG: PEP/pyruvate-binding domain-containing protein, partial [Natronomonas sp.]|nr:PEP/pyruvate-binding domain-containing protein [Natronomonas sp.]